MSNEKNLFQNFESVDRKADGQRISHLLSFFSFKLCILNINSMQEWANQAIARVKLFL